MSNKAVPLVYRAIIDDVIQSAKQDFDEIGIEDSVLEQLQLMWEEKIAQSRVADFSDDGRMAAQAKLYPPVPTPSSTGDYKSSPVDIKGERDLKTEKKSAVDPNDDEINSDLDDSDDEDIIDEDTNDDLIIALYEKVHHVKNKWKVTLRDGLISIGGKEYLFSKCNGEFEW